MPWPSSLVLLSAIAAATTRLRLAACAVIAPLRHPAPARPRARHARPPLRGPARRAAHRQLAPRRVRGARRPVRAARRASRRAPRRVGGSLARHAVRRSPASTTPTRTSTSSRRPGARTGRASGSAASRCTLASSVGSSATPTAFTRSGSPSDADLALLARRARRGGPRPRASSSSSAACAPSFPDDHSPSAARAGARDRSRRSSARGFTHVLHQAVAVRRRHRALPRVVPRGRRARWPRSLPEG